MTVDANTTEEAARILLIAGDVAWNLGDRAIRAAIVDQFRRACPGAEVIAYTKTPARDREQFRIDGAVSSMRELLKRARYGEFDAVLWGGGHLLQDDSSKLKCVYWAWCFRPCGGWRSVRSSGTASASARWIPRGESSSRGAP